MRPLVGSHGIFGRVPWDLGRVPWECPMGTMYVSLDGIDNKLCA